MGTTTLIQGFDASNIQPFGGGATALPIGHKMLVQIIDADVRGSRNSSGSNNTAGGVSLTFQVLDGEHTGKIGSEWYHIYPGDGNDPKAGEIAKQKLAAIAYATGRLSIGQDLRQWFSVPFRIDTSAQADQPNRTNILAYYDAHGTPVAQLASNASRAVPPAPSFQGQQQPQAQYTAPQYNPSAAVPIATPGFTPPAANNFQNPAPNFSTPPAGFNQPPASAPVQSIAPGFQQPGFNPNSAPAAFTHQTPQQQPAQGQWGRQ